jgi:hypothetical protein
MAHALQILHILAVLRLGKPARRTEDKPLIHLCVFLGIVTLLEAVENVWIYAEPILSARKDTFVTSSDMQNPLHRQHRN